jgi:hypothetical protein
MKDGIIIVILLLFCTSLGAKAVLFDLPTGEQANKLAARDNPEYPQPRNQTGAEPGAPLLDDDQARPNRNRPGPWDN